MSLYIESAMDINRNYLRINNMYAYRPDTHSPPIMTSGSYSPYVEHIHDNIDNTMHRFNTGNFNQSYTGYVHNDDFSFSGRTSPEMMQIGQADSEKPRSAIRRYQQHAKYKDVVDIKNTVRRLNRKSH